MKVAFCTHCSDDIFESIGGKKLVASAKYFHPDIPFYIFGTKEINEVFAKDPRINWNNIHPFITSQLIDEYDVVYHFDADSMIVDTLDELFDESNLQYDIIGVRNNNDIGKAGKDPAIHERFDVFTYLNCGLVGMTNSDFIERWKQLNLDIADTLPFQEQSVLNILAHTDGIKVRILDPVESFVYYGISNLYGTNSHWDSWQDISVVGGKLLLNGKRCKVLHQAGGHAHNKLSFDQFNMITAMRLNAIYEGGLNA